MVSALEEIKREEWRTPSTGRVVRQGFSEGLTFELALEELKPAINYALMMLKINKLVT